ncbi:MAG: general secretion pathway protein GspB [Thiogranum sp.]|nr:general secretion pathway protein GspB [Thiogranum sp.]
MSYILEALKKAEQQRELGQVPGIASDHGAGVPGTRKYRLWIFMLVTNLTVLALILFFWLRDEPSSTRSSDSALHEPVVALPAPAKLVPREYERELESFGPAHPAAAVDSFQAPEPQQPLGQVDPVKFLPSKPAATTELPVWPQIPERLLAELSGGLRLDVHVYSEAPEERFVLINLARYKEGESLRDGPLIEAIYPQGVILSLQGQRFRLLSQ